MRSRRVVAVLAVLSVGLALVVASTTRRETTGPTGLGPELDELFERCWADPAAVDTCYEIEDVADAASRPVAGARGAADELCLQLIPVDASRLAGLRAQLVTRELEGEALMCSSPTRSLSLSVFRGTGPLRCVGPDVTRRCYRLPDGSQVKDLDLPDGPGIARILRRWDDGDAVMVVVGPNRPGHEERDASSVARDLAQGAATAFDLGR